MIIPQTTAGALLLGAGRYVRSAGLLLVLALTVFPAPPQAEEEVNVFQGTAKAKMRNAAGPPYESEIATSRIFVVSADRGAGQAVLDRRFPGRRDVILVASEARARAILRAEFGKIPTGRGLIPGTFEILLRPYRPGSNIDRVWEVTRKFQPVFAPRPATRVRVLLACDTDAPGGIAAGVAFDLRMMETFFSHAFRGQPGMCEIAKLSGPNLTAKNVLEYYQRLPSNPTETLVFYYAGHGGMRGGRFGQHCLALTHKPWLRRADLLAEMDKRPHQCLILLTDCCSNSTLVDEKQYEESCKKVAHLFGKPGRGSLSGINPLRMPSGVDGRTIDWLFLRHTGTIDITAATPSRDQSSWTSAKTGGFFTFSLVQVLRSDVNRINQGRRGRVENQVTWRMAFERVQSGAALMSLGRRNPPSVDVLMKTSARDRDRVWQWAHAFSFH